MGLQIINGLQACLLVFYNDGTNDVGEGSATIINDDGERVAFNKGGFGEYFDEESATYLYLAMGWLVVIAARPVVEALPGATLAWLAIGGLAYSGGMYFYANRRIPYGHAIWHLCVMAGSTAHVVAAALLILLPA